MSSDRKKCANYIARVSVYTMLEVMEVSKLHMVTKITILFDTITMLDLTPVTSFSQCIHIQDT